MPGYYWKHVFAAVVLSTSSAFAQAPSEPAKPIPFTSAQATHGNAVYLEQCASCHGSGLDGGPGGPPLKGGAFRARFQQQPGDALITFIREKMPPGGAGALTSPDYAALVAHILAVNGGKAGTAALSADPRVLAPLNLTATLPSMAVVALKKPDYDQGAGVVPDSFVLAADKRRSERLKEITPVTDAMLRDPPEGDWLNPRRTYDAHAFSPLNQINRANVARLQMGWVWELPPSKNEITPLVHDGIMFVVSGNRLQALDATTGELLWQYAHPNPVGIVRNLGIYGENIFYPAETDMVALNMRTGKVAWQKPIVPDGYTMGLRAGPLIVKGLVLQGVGMCVGTYPGGCYLVALDAATGNEVWRFQTLARPGQPGGNSWNNLPVDQRLGGGIWNAGSYDPELNLIYFGTGQTYKLSSLLNGYDGRPGGNDALYTNTTLALRPETGELAWYYQHHARDVWDLDWSFERTLATLMIDGKPRRTVTTAGKLTIFDTIDAATGQYLFSYDVGLQNLVTSIDPKTGAKTVDPALEPVPNKPELVCPSTWGGRDWMSTSFNAKTGILYVPQNELCNEFEWLPSDGSVDFSVKVRHRPNSDGMIGRVEAIDVASHKSLWVQRRRAPESSAILGTAGGLIFEGSRDRVFRASDERSGKVLWQTQLDAPPSAYPVTYRVNGVQYIAVVAGGGGPVDATPGRAITPEISSPASGTTIWVFRLPDKK